MPVVSKAGYMEKLPSSSIKWGSSGWKKRHIVVKSRGGQGNMANPDMVAWHEKEGKPQAGMLEITPGSTLIVDTPDKGDHPLSSSRDGMKGSRPVPNDAGFMIRTYDADMLMIRVPPGTSKLADEHKASAPSSSKSTEVSISRGGACPPPEA